MTWGEAPGAHLKVDAREYAAVVGRDLECADVHARQLLLDQVLHVGHRSVGVRDACAFYA